MKSSRTTDTLLAAKSAEFVSCLTPLAAACALLLAVASGLTATTSGADDWRYYGRDENGQRFSPLTEIRKNNVGQLRVAWRYHAGGNSTELHTAMECTPLIVSGVMYVTSPVLEVIALDAASGKELWKYNPFPEKPSYTRLWIASCVGMLALLTMVAVMRRWRGSRAVGAKHYVTAAAILMVFGAGASYGSGQQYARRLLRALLPDPRLEQKHLGPNRGLTYWESGSDKRIFFAGGHRLVALDASSGRPVAGFGRTGVVELTRGLSRSVEHDFYTVTSPGVICRDVLVLGSSVAEGPEPAAPGDVRGFDVRTGRQLWTFHTVPQPGAAGADTWPKEALAKAGGVNAWGGMVADEKRGLVFVPTGSPAFDYFGGDRAGDNLYGDSLVAIHGENGQPAWHYQMVRHDLWDYDLPCPPVLVTLTLDARPVDAVVQPTKQGFLFVLDRSTGKPLFPVEERSVPESDVPGEVAARTQPMPLKPAPLVRQSITENDLTDLSEKAHEQALRAFRELAGASVFLPPSRKGTLVVPGFQGGANWGGASVDPRHARLLINTNEIPYRLRIAAAKPEAGFLFTVQNFNDPFVDAEGYPAIRPPWGKLSAVNLESGAIEWQAPLGEYAELTKRGVPVTGMDNIGGSLQTGSGLAFIAATKDRKIRAFDTDNGRVLWSADLSAAGHATPATYAAKGRQFVVIAAGGGSIAESSPSGDEYVAFSLPN